MIEVNNSLSEGEDKNEKAPNDDILLINKRNNITVLAVELLSNPTLFASAVNQITDDYSSVNPDNYERLLIYIRGLNNDELDKVSKVLKDYSRLHNLK